MFPSNNHWASDGYILLYALTEAPMNPSFVIFWVELSATNKHPIVCYGYGKVESNAFGTQPSFEDDAREKGPAQEKRVDVVYKKVSLNGEEFMWNEDTSELYAMKHYNEVKENPNLPLQPFGRLVQKNNKYLIEKM